MSKKSLDRIIQEKFGDSIGSYKGGSAIGVRDERESGDDLDDQMSLKPGQLEEARARVSPEEIEITWEDLSHESEYVSLESLASWLAVPEEVVMANLPSWLVVDVYGDVVQNVAEGKKGGSKKQAKSFIKGTKKFSDKVAKAKAAGMKNPEGFAAWAQHKATGKWPSEK